MKLISNIKIAILALLVVAAGCKPQDFTGGLGDAPTSDQVKFSATPDASNPNIINFTNQTPGTATALWDLGNGNNTDGFTVQGQYPLAGTYTVKLTVFTKGGYASTTKTVTIASTNYAMLNREDYNMLTGGAAATNGKTWRIEAETKGHLGVGPIGEASPIWYQAGPNEKAANGYYDDRLIFKLQGFQFINQNNGTTFSNWEFATDLGGTASGQTDPTINYTPPANQTWSILEEGGKKYLVLGNKGFIGYYSGATRYEILKLTNDELYIKGNSKKPADGWWQMLVRDGYTRPIVPKAVKPMELNDNFDIDGNVTWKKETLTLNESYDNPLPLAPNTSAKVAMYAKMDGQAYEFANMFADFAYKFDLTTKRTIKLKVFMPSSNDFVTANGESWANPRLLKQVSVKLQDGSSAQPWVNQVEIIRQVTQLDKWVELTFDFSGSASRKDLDRLVIQIGGEGNFIPGIFFIDDIRVE